MTQRIAIIDLGSNTTRLVVYDYEPGLRFHLVDEVREVVRLREGMGNGMALRAVAIDRAQRATVSYTHLDVYKRQVPLIAPSAP